MLRKQRERKTKPYTTSDWDDDPNGPPNDPIIALRRLPKGPTYFLHELLSRDARKKWLYIGHDPGRCDIVLLEPDKEDPTVNARHCSLLCTPDMRVKAKHCPGGVNRTKVNRTRLDPGPVELSPDDVLRLGEVRLVALNKAGLAELAEQEHQPKTTAKRPADYFRRATDNHLNPAKAAKALRFPRRTLIDWLSGGRFGKKS